MRPWRAYERLIALLESDKYDEKYTVIPNARITGFISKIKRQIDILIDYRFSTDLERRIIIDAKNRKRPIDIKEVEEFEGLMKDVNAQRGIIVCANGHTKTALNRAEQHIGLKLVPASEIDNLDLNTWDACRSLKCGNGLVLWDATPGVIYNGLISIQAIGKCDECGKFHIWCWDCGNKKVIEKKEDEWRCDCKGPWFWLTSIETDEDENGKTYKSNYLILVMGNGNYEIVDRRPL